MKRSPRTHSAARHPGAPGSLALLLVLTAVLYAPGLRAWYFADDFLYFFDPPREHVLAEFVRPNPNDGVFWRPIQSSLLALQQVASGLETWPCHLLQLAMHCALVAVVYALCRDIGGSKLQSFCAAAFCALAQIGVQTVVGVDTVSQGGATLFLALAARAMLQATEGLGEVPRAGHPRHLASLGLFGVSLLMKETAVSGVPILALAAAVPALRRGEGRAPAGNLRRLSVSLALLVVVFLLYWIWRASVVKPPGPDHERYEFDLGTNLFKNVAFLSGSILIPVSPHRIVLWRHFGGAQAILLFAGVTLSFVVLVLDGLRHVPSRKWLAVALAAFLASLPASLIAHVNEVYAYNVLPAASLLVGLGAGAALSRLRPRGAVAPAAAAGSILAVVVVMHVWALREKTDLMVRNGGRARSLYAQVIHAARAAPPRSTILLFAPPATRPGYSVLVAPGLDVLTSAWTSIRAQSGPGVRIRVVDAPPETLGTGMMLYTVDDGDLVLGRGGGRALLPRGPAAPPAAADRGSR